MKRLKRLWSRMVDSCVLCKTCQNKPHVYQYCGLIILVVFCVGIFLGLRLTTISKVEIGTTPNQIRLK